jgi:alpha-ribazole phosphatase
VQKLSQQGAGLWFVRHAQPLIAPGVCYGALDVPADPKASAAAAAELANSLPLGAQVMHSPLQRCELLVQLIKGLRPDLTYKSDNGIREMDFGQWEGQRWDTIDPVQLKAWTDDFAHYRCGDTGECTADFVRRVHSAVQRMPAGVPAVWISHVGVMRAIVWLREAGLLGLPWAFPGSQHLFQTRLRAHEWPEIALGFGQKLHLEWPLG